MYSFLIPIVPFPDGNGRTGRLIMFKECLRNNIVPFIITDQYKGYYFRRLKEWQTGGEKGFLRDICLMDTNNRPLPKNINPETVNLGRGIFNNTPSQIRN